ncbi:hypothetical protein [Nafulsella turpanensis]|uniref:hypothetical protein n=1 Tax=Nafulsella turpanensis TaxID=1265690 RepID=UPI00034AC339|nr:hypothetical protein [Nafulsella turpanensis]
MKKARPILSIFIIGFLLNLVWENVQAPLYKGYTNFWDHFMMCFWASLVDVAVILLLYGLLAIWYRDFYWIKHINWKIAVVLIIIGGTIAVGFEYWALENETWAYTDSMPVVPFTKVGLSPLLQMMLLPLLTIWLSHKMVIKRKTDGKPAAL